MINFDISIKAVEKAKEQLKKEEQLQLCLQAKVCPICARKLTKDIDVTGDSIYECTNCTFTILTV